MGYYPPDAVAVVVGQQGTSSYCWGDQCEFHFLCEVRLLYPLHHDREVR